MRDPFQIDHPTCISFSGSGQCTSSCAVSAGPSGTSSSAFAPTNSAAGRCYRVRREQIQAAPTLRPGAAGRERPHSRRQLRPLFPQAEISAWR